jgi:hypothetical protein
MRVGLLEVEDRPRVLRLSKSWWSRAGQGGRRWFGAARAYRAGQEAAKGMKRRRRHQHKQGARGDALAASVPPPLPLIPDHCKKECWRMSASQPASSFKTTIGLANHRWRHRIMRPQCSGMMGVKNEASTTFSSKSGQGSVIVECDTRIICLPIAMSMPSASNLRLRGELGFRWVNCGAPTHQGAPKRDDEAPTRPSSARPSRKRFVALLTR